MKTLKFLALVFLSIFGILYALYFSYIYFNQSNLIFKTFSLPKNYVFNFEKDFEEINITTKDGKKINSLLFKTKNPKGLVFYLHGNSGALDTWGNIASTYTLWGYDFFILDYRGFGKSEGKIENQKQFLDDINCAYTAMNKRYEPQKTVIIGYSIGTGAASWLAYKKKSKMLILKAPFYNFNELSSHIVPYFPDQFKKFSFETNTYLPKIKVPIYIFQGTKDRLIPYQNSVNLSLLLKPTDSLFALKDVEHIGISENNMYQSKLKQFLK